MQLPFNSNKNHVMFDFGNQMQNYAISNWFAIIFNIVAIFQIIIHSSFQLFLIFWFLFMICVLFGNLKFLNAINFVIERYSPEKLVEFKKIFTKAYVGMVVVSLIYPLLFSYVFFSSYHQIFYLILNTTLFLLFCWILISNFLQLSMLSLNEWIHETFPKEQKWTNLLISSIFHSSDDIKLGSHMMIFPVLNLWGILVYQSAFAQLGTSLKIYSREIDLINVSPSVIDPNLELFDSLQTPMLIPIESPVETSFQTYFAPASTIHHQIHLKFCPTCGENLFPKAQFCSNCGFKLF